LVGGLQAAHALIDGERPRSRHSCLSLGGVVGVSFPVLNTGDIKISVEGFRELGGEMRVVGRRGYYGDYLAGLDATNYEAGELIFRGRA